VSLFVRGDLHKAVVGPNRGAGVDEVLRVLFQGFGVARRIEDRGGGLDVTRRDNLC
jgi:hypothetical protein